MKLYWAAETHETYNLYNQTVEQVIECTKSKHGVLIDTNMNDNLGLTVYVDGQPDEGVTIWRVGHQSKRPVMSDGKKVCDIDWFDIDELRMEYVCL